MPRPTPSPSARRSFHSHMWLVGLLGVAVGLILLVYAPNMRGISSSMLFFALFHLIGAAIIGLSTYLSWVQPWQARRLAARLLSDEIRFTSSPRWVNGQGVSSLASMATALAVEIAYPGFWPLTFILLLLGSLFAYGSHVVRRFQSTHANVLPAIRFPEPCEHVLDLGCGTGRVTLALARAGIGVNIVAYEDGHSGDEAVRTAMLANNLKLAGIEQHVEQQVGSLAVLPFPDASFDLVVSANVLDHRGGDRLTLLGEVRRVLRPGGQLLLIVRVPGTAMLGAINVFALLLTTRTTWKRLAAEARFQAADEGEINHAWFLVLRRPA